MAGAVVASDSTASTTAADTTSGAAASANAATVAAANPAGVAAYSASGSVFGNVAIAGNMSGNLPSSLETATFNDMVGAVPAGTKGVGKGAKRGDITRVSDLVKLVAAISQGQPLYGFDPQVLADTFKAAKFTPKQVAQVTAGYDPNPGASGLSPQEQKTATGAAWKAITQHLSALGVAIPADDMVAPNAANAMNKLKSLGSLPLDHVPTLDAFHRQGYDISGMHNVESLISGHDSSQFAKGAPGTTASTAAVPGHPGTTTGAGLWDDFQTKWNANATTNGQTYHASMVQTLSAIGALDVSGTPTPAQVGQAYQKVMTSAATDGLSIPAEITKIAGAGPKGPEGQPLTSENVDQATVMHYANEFLGPNALTPYQAQTLANVANKNGTASTSAVDIITQGVASMAPALLAKTPGQAPAGASFLGAAYQTVQDTFAAWGLHPDPATTGKFASEAVAAGPQTPYQITALAAAQAENYAKTQAGVLYGAGVGAQANAGVTVKDQASPYLSTAAALLGSSATEMQVSDPTGKWMKWSTGGSGPGGSMTQAEWSHYLMTDPSYGFEHSQTAKDTSASAAQGLLQMMGKLPNSPNPFAGASLATATTGAAA